MRPRFGHVRLLRQSHSTWPGLLAREIDERAQQSGQVALARVVEVGRRVVLSLREGRYRGHVCTVLSFDGDVGHLQSYSSVEGPGRRVWSLVQSIARVEGRPDATRALLDPVIEGHSALADAYAGVLMSLLPGAAVGVSYRARARRRGTVRIAPARDAEEAARIAAKLA